jgi:Holliday junction DNA helicase RuvA
MEELFIHTYLHVQDDAMVLYGFSSLEERSLFREIISISGIGPKKAIGMLSSIGPSEFIRAVQERQLSVLTSLPGIGKKTAERILLELKDKFKDPVWDQAEHEPAATRTDIVDDAVDALIALGYSQAEALHMVISAKDKLTDNDDLQELLKLALASNSR